MVKGLVEEMVAEDEECASYEGGEHYRWNAPVHTFVDGALIADGWSMLRWNFIFIRYRVVHLRHAWAKGCKVSWTFADGVQIQGARNAHLESAVMWLCIFHISPLAVVYARGDCERTLQTLVGAYLRV